MSKYAIYGISLQVLFLSMLLAETGHAQNESLKDIKISVNWKNTKLKNVFADLRTKTGFKFNFNDSEINVNKNVSATITEKSMDEVLRALSAKANLKFRRVNGNIHVAKKEGFQKPVVEVDSYADVNISGKVTDENGEGLPGASIVEMGTTNGTTTDLDGNYKLKLDEAASLEVSFVGYKTVEITIAGRSTIDLQMELDAAQLEEIVVVGYGTVKKSDLTGSVVSVNTEEINAFPTAGTLEALQGRAAGVLIQANNGGPGSSHKIRIRGGTSINSSSDPLFVVDGFPGGTMPPTDDIASIEVLKDASATAIYGSRGANGVILVTTKKGKAGRTIVEFNASYSSQKEIGRYDLLETSDFIEYHNELFPGTYDPNGNYANTDWQDEIFQKGHTKNYQVALSGGNDKVNYYVSGIVFGQKGTIINSDFKRYSLTSNLDIEVSNNVRVGVNLYGSSATTNGIPTQEGSGGAGNTGVVSAALKMEPTLAIYDIDGNYALSKIGDPHDNPFAIANERLDENEREVIQSNFFVDWEILEGLNWRSTLGFKYSGGRRGFYLPTTLNAGNDVNGRAQLDVSRNKNVITEHYLSYNKSINDVHDFTVMGGYSYQSFSDEFIRSVTQDFISDSFIYWNLGGGANTQPSTSRLTEAELASYYGRFNYKFSDRYLLTFTARYDGSSRFAKNNKYAFFPSGAVAWNISEEAFMGNVSAINQLKLRGSYGITGNQAIGSYQSLAQFSSISSTVLDDNIVNAVAISTVANDNLTWESTTQLDIGLDIGLFGQRIGLVVDYYTMKTDDQLFRLPLPEYSGYSNMWQNIGAVENKGFEFTLSTVNVEGDFKWTTDLNFSKNKNTILELPDGNDIFLSTQPGHMVGIGNTQILREGESVGAFYGFIYDGVYQDGDSFIPGGGFEQEAGGQKFKDINGRDDEGELTGEPDGQLNNDDRTIIGNPHPDFTLGFSNTFEYKGFDLNIFLYTSQGNDIYSYTLYELDYGSASNNATTNILNRWTPSNTNTDVPKASSSRTRKSSDRFIYDGSFIRLKNIALGYSLPESITSRVGMSSARVYVSAQNLFTITDYPGVDPEVNYRTGSGSAGNTNLGFDYGSYPNMKSVTFGIQVKF